MSKSNVIERLIPQPEAVRECCLLCEHGVTTSATLVNCNRTNECMDYLEKCRHFKLMRVLQVGLKETREMKIINLTQHEATPEQKAAGVIDIVDLEDRKILIECLTFDELPDADEIADRARKLANMAQPYASHAMTGGAPYLMAPLEYELSWRGVQPLYAFSKRESVEEEQLDGSVKKTVIFRHLGFVWVE